MSSTPSPGDLFLADEGVDFRIVASLRQQGFQVASVAEEFPSIPDTAVLSLAVERDAVLITEDKDFGEMIFQRSLRSHGVLLTPHTTTAC